LAGVQINSAPKPIFFRSGSPKPLLLPVSSCYLRVINPQKSKAKLLNRRKRPSQNFTSVFSVHWLLNERVGPEPAPWTTKPPAWYKTELDKTMKRLLFCGIAFFTLNLGMAQNVHFGVKAGLNAAMLTVKGQKATEFKPGLHAGAQAHIHILDQLALQPELFYSGQGGKRIINNVDYKTNLHYLNLPVLLQYMFNNGFRLQAGPQIGFLLSAQQKANESKSNIIGQYKAIDVSLPVGVSYLSDSGLGVDLRWAFGLTNLNDDDDNLPVVRNQVGQIGLFYLLHYDH
jgi:hypothetical protein